MAQDKPINRIVDMVVDALENGVQPWRKPWESKDGAASVCLPLRADHQPYSGMNAITLMMAGAAAGYASPYWLTYKQAKSAGGQVRKGERSMPAILYKTRVVENEDDPDDAHVMRFLKCYPVFCADQCENLPEKFFSVATERPSEAPTDAVLDAFPVPIRYGGDRAFYSEAHDFIQMPEPNAFESPECFLSTKAHEQIHATKHDSRLARDFGCKKWGDEAYAIEELVAELGSVLLCTRFALNPEHFNSHAAYIGQWAEAIKTHPNALLSAAAHAEKAVNYILAFSVGKGLISPKMPSRTKEVAA